MYQFLILLTICPNCEPTGLHNQSRKYRRFSRMRPSKYHFSTLNLFSFIVSDITSVYPERNLLVKLIMILDLVCPCQQMTEITLPLM